MRRSQRRRHSLGLPQKPCGGNQTTPTGGVVVGYENFAQSIVVRHQCGPEHAGGVFPARVGRAAVNALELRAD